MTNEREKKNKSSFLTNLSYSHPLTPVPKSLHPPPALVSAPSLPTHFHSHYPPVIFAHHCPAASAFHPPTLSANPRIIKAPPPHSTHTIPIELPPFLPASHPPQCANSFFLCQDLYINHTNTATPLRALTTLAITASGPAHVLLFPPAPLTIRTPGACIGVNDGEGEKPKLTRSAGARATSSGTPV